MLIKTRKEIPSSEITPERIYRNRREFLKKSSQVALVAGIGGSGLISPAAQAKGYAEVEYNEGDFNLASRPQWLQDQVAARKALPDSGPFVTDEELSTFDVVTNYNNFYEFGTAKQDPSRNAEDFRVEPWTVEVAGECGKPGTYTLEDILAPHTFEDRIYRLRCVEAWSMVIPWMGFPLADLLQRFEPNGNAKFVAFQTLVDDDQMPAVGSRFATIDWPYQEGLRMDEAMHPLTLMTTGVYGNVLPVQNGAPLRLIVPWKYGFKSVKSIVRIEFRRDMPATSWNDLQPREYGFYANVNPEVSHPRWSQASERRLTSPNLFGQDRIDTMMFNGYTDEVAHLYDGMDLRRNY